MSEKVDPLVDKIAQAGKDASNIKPYLDKFDHLKKEKQKQVTFKKASAPQDDSFFYFYTRTQNQYVMLNKTPFVKLHGFGGLTEN